MDRFTCPSDRREFLQTGGCFLLMLATLGLGASDAEALPVVMVVGAGAVRERRYPLPASDSVNVDRDASAILVRFQNRVYAFALSCPHENAAVKWLKKDNKFQCTKHDSEYTPVGVFTSGHSTRNLDRFAVHVEQGMVVVDLTRWFQSDKDAVGWAAAAVPL